MSTQTMQLRAIVDPEAAVRDAIATIGNVLFLETARREAVARGPRNQQLNDLLLTAERQLLWDALQRLRGHERPDRPVQLCESQAKYVERLDWLKRVLAGSDPLSILFLTDLQEELQRRTGKPWSEEGAP